MEISVFSSLGVLGEVKDSMAVAVPNPAAPNAAKEGFKISCW